MDVSSSEGTFLTEIGNDQFLECLREYVDEDAVEEWRRLKTLMELPTADKVGRFRRRRFERRVRGVHAREIRPGIGSFGAVHSENHGAVFKVYG